MTMTTPISTSCHTISVSVAAARKGWMALLRTRLSGICMPPSKGSGVQIGDQLTLKFHDLILERELALLEPLELQLIDMDVHREARDDLVQVPVLDAQLPQL